MPSKRPGAANLSFIDASDEPQARSSCMGEQINLTEKESGSLIKKGQAHSKIK